MPGVIETQQDTLRDYDGFNDQSGGMDSALSPEVIGGNNYALGVNITARDGMPKTRPRFQRIDMVAPAAFRAGYWQGSGNYYNPTTGAKLVLAAVSGRIYLLDPIGATITDLSATGNGNALVNADDARHYFCQAANFMVINDGQDTPLIFDGSVLKRAIPTGTPNMIPQLPVGSMMAFGQGRLFVVSEDRTSFMACDLIYGGSSSAISILNSQVYSKDQTRALITTGAVNTFQTGDSVTISGHNSTPTINGTWQITVINSSSFTIPAQIVAAGMGGYATDAFAGQMSDCLNATEWLYLNEKGIFSLPTSMGKIMDIFFYNTLDTGTGQGPLMVIGEYGAMSYQVQQPRGSWLNIQMASVALQGIGATSDNGTELVNGDVFFTSWDGLRSYRSARSQMGNSYSQSPVSSEMNRIALNVPRGSLVESSLALFDQRLLWTTSPVVIPATDPAAEPTIVHRSLTALDFNMAGRLVKTAEGSWVTAVSGATYGVGAFEGIWTGLDILQLVRGAYGEEERLFAFTFNVAAAQPFAAVPFGNGTTGITSLVPSGTQQTITIYFTASWSPSASFVSAFSDPARRLFISSEFGGNAGPLDVSVTYAGTTIDFTATNNGSATNVVQFSILIAYSAGGQREIELWEITTSQTDGCDRFRDVSGNLTAVPIQAVLETRAMVFASPKRQKTLTRADLWLASIRGATNFRAYWRPDMHPGGWFFWGSWTETGSACASISTVGPCTHQPQIQSPLFAPQRTLTTPPEYADAGTNGTNRRAEKGYSIQLRIEWDGLAQIQKLWATAVEIVEASQATPPPGWTLGSGAAPQIKSALGPYSVLPISEP